MLKAALSAVKAPRLVVKVKQAKGGGGLGCVEVLSDEREEQTDAFTYPY